MAVGTTVPATILKHPREQMNTFQGVPIQALGHVHGNDVPSNSHRLGTIAPNNQATYALLDNAIYEITVYDLAAPDDGDAENILVKPVLAGGTIASLDFAGATPTDAFLVPTSKIPVFQIRMPAGYPSLAIGALSTVSVKTLLIFARRLQ